MTTTSPLLMIPGPIEISPAVVRAAAISPPSHVSPTIIESFGSAIEQMRHVWLSEPSSQPFIVAGSGTLAMEMAVTNLLEPGQRALVVNSGYFSDRMATMLERRGVLVSQLRASLGHAPDPSKVNTALQTEDYAAVFATHVDTSTGVRVDARAIAQAAQTHGVLSVFDGVCATAAESFPTTNVTRSPPR